MRPAGRGCTPHFLCWRQRKRAVHGPKETAFPSQNEPLLILLAEVAGKKRFRCPVNFLPGAPFSFCAEVHSRIWRCRGILRWLTDLVFFYFRAFTVSACGPPSISVTSETCFTGSFLLCQREPPVLPGGKRAYSDERSKREKASELKREKVCRPDPRQPEGLFMTNYKTFDLKKLTIGRWLARLRAVGQVMQAKVYSMRLETLAGIMPF